MSSGEDKKKKMLKKNLTSMAGSSARNLLVSYLLNKNLKNPIFQIFVRIKLLYEKHLKYDLFYP